MRGSDDWGQELGLFFPWDTQVPLKHDKLYVSFRAEEGKQNRETDESYPPPPTASEVSHLRLDYSYTILPGNKAVTVNIWALFLFQLTSCPYRNMRCENIAPLLFVLNSCHTVFDSSENIFHSKLPCYLLWVEVQMPTVRSNGVKVQCYTCNNSRSIQTSLKELKPDKKNALWNGHYVKGPSGHEHNLELSEKTKGRKVSAQIMFSLPTSLKRKCVAITFVNWNKFWHRQTDRASGERLKS